MDVTRQHESHMQQPSRRSSPLPSSSQGYGGSQSDIHLERGLSQTSDDLWITQSRFMDQGRNDTTQEAKDTTQSDHENTGGKKKVLRKRKHSHQTRSPPKGWELCRGCREQARSASTSMNDPLQQRLRIPSSDRERRRRRQPRRMIVKVSTIAPKESNKVRVQRYCYTCGKPFAYKLKPRQVTPRPVYQAVRFRFSFPSSSESESETEDN